MAIDKMGKEILENLAAGKPLLGSNKAINTIFGGYEMGARMIKGAGLDEAFNHTFRKAAEGAAAATAADPINVGKMAGSYIGLSAGYRVLSGGGLHRDAKGNPNLIGVPFV